MSTVQVDTINESTTGSGVTVDGVLIKDNFVASTAGGGLVKLASATASSSADLTFDNFVDNDTYIGYHIYFQQIQSAGAGINLQAKFRSSTPADITGTYRRGGLGVYYDASGSVAYGNQSSTNFAIVGTSLGTTDIKAFNARGYFVPTDNSKGTAHIMVDGYYQLNDGSFRNQRVSHGLESASTDVAGVSFAMATGNIASGTIAIFGVKK